MSHNTTTMRNKIASSNVNSKNSKKRMTLQQQQKIPTQDSIEEDPSGQPIKYIITIGNNLITIFIIFCLEEILTINYNNNCL